MIEPIAKKTFQKLMPSGDMAEVGNKDSPDFKPHLKLNRWNGECFIKVGLPTHRKIAPIIEGIKTKWIDKDIEADFYPLEPKTVTVKNKDGNDVPSTQNELGGFEFEIILKKKPKTNQIVLNIETQGLKFCYQPELTPEEIAEGAIRADNVDGSYAVYHATRTPFHKSRADAEKYKCGKAFHIYRPKVKDALGRETWAILGINEAKGTLTITIPQDFLGNAAYPVSIDPNFGYETPGGTSLYLENYVYGGVYAGATGDAASITIYLYIESGSGTALYKGGLYRVSDNVLVGTTLEGSYDISGGHAWRTVNFSPAVAISAVDYTIVSFGEASVGYVVYIRADAGTVADGRWYKNVTYNGFPTPFDGSKASSLTNISIYCTYSEAEPTPVPVADGDLIGIAIIRKS